jgi:serine-type D-Ala-D-Ala carboxypeptidase/endopeptidase (penicillin-binding protein 4)
VRWAGARAALAAAGALVICAGPAAAGPAQVALDRFAAANPGTSALVWRLGDDGAPPTVVASVRPDQPRIPASNMKLVTAAGALIQLGDGFRFTTTLATTQRARVSGGTLRGPVFVLGSGDPLLATRAYAARYLPGRATPMLDLVRPVSGEGIRRIAGPIVADESLFDTMRSGPRWPGRYALYSQPLSALSSNQGFAGDMRRADSPAPWRSTAQRVRAGLRGVRVAHDGPLRRGRTPNEVRVLARATSVPVARIVREMNVTSDNFIAEMLVKAVGVHGSGQGTTAAGTGRTRSILDGIGVLAAGDRLVDGSGLSRENRLAATSLVRLIAAADADPRWGRAFFASLPKGREGTLAGRFRSAAVAGRVQAKTGFINGVSGLSGRVVSRGGQRYAFSLLMNTSRTGDARTTQNRVVTLLALGQEDVPR